MPATLTSSNANFGCVQPNHLQAILPRHAHHSRCPAWNVGFSLPEECEQYCATGRLFARPPHLPLMIPPPHVARPGVESYGRVCCK